MCPMSLSADEGYLKGAILEIFGEWTTLVFIGAADCEISRSLAAR